MHIKGSILNFVQFELPVGHLNRCLSRLYWVWTSGGWGLQARDKHLILVSTILKSNPTRLPKEASVESEDVIGLNPGAPTPRGEGKEKPIKETSR